MRRGASPCRGKPHGRRSRPPTTDHPSAQVYYFHTQTNGLPEELSDTRGNIVWRAQYKTWGSTAREEWQAFDDMGKPVGAPQAQPVIQALYPPVHSPAQPSAHSPAHQAPTTCLPTEQNLRMQGQYLDRETGLHYNTFRFYDPDLGAFTTPDPIGLNGGFNLYSYAPNPVAWVDPWGLSYCAKSDRYRNDKTGRYDKDPRVKKPSSIQDRMAMDAAKKGAGTRIMGGQTMNNDRYKGWEKMEYKVKSADGRNSVVHYVRDPKTGKTADFKFKERTSDKIGDYAKKTEPKVSAGD